MSELGETLATSVRRRGTADERGSGMWSLLRSLWRNRRMVAELARREMTDFHAGQMAGATWLLLHPLVMFTVYATLFTIVFKVRIAAHGPSDYLVYLFSGLAPWLITQDAMMRATNVMISNASIVKKVMMPLEVLVAKALAASMSVQSILLVLTVVYSVIERGHVPMIMLLLPVLLLMHVALIWGLALLLAAFTPYFRDLSEVVRVFITVNIYLLPIMYSPTMVPARLRGLLALNPFSHLIWCYQDVIYFDSVAHPWSWAITAALATVSVLAGSYVFSRLRHHLPSVI